MRRRFWLVGLLIVGLMTGIFGFRTNKLKNPQERTGKASPLTRALWFLSGIDTAPLYLRVVDGTTMKPIPGAGCVIPETNQRIETDEKGVAPVIRAPVMRDPRADDLVSAIHGELSLLCYKKNYRDAIVTGIRMYDDTPTQFEAYMTPFGPQDKRLEPTFFHIPPHQLWQVSLVDHFRLFDAGMGKESPALTRPGNLTAPQAKFGVGVQTPIRPGPGATLESQQLQSPTPRVSPHSPQPAAPQRSQ